MSDFFINILKIKTFFHCSYEPSSWGHHTTSSRYNFQRWYNSYSSKKIKNRLYYIDLIVTIKLVIPNNMACQVQMDLWIICLLYFYGMQALWTMLHSFWVTRNSGSFECTSFQMLQENSSPQNQPKELLVKPQHLQPTLNVHLWVSLSTCSLDFPETASINFH